MKLIFAFLKLIRWPNLLMIILVQTILHFLLIGNVFNLIQMESPFSGIQFLLLMLSTITMAAFGYAFNDVQDVKTDEINKNTKRIIDVQISKKAGIVISGFFLSISLIIALYLSIDMKMIQLFFIHLIIAAGLWYYSVELKKKVLSGNIVVSLFTSVSIFIIWLYHLIIIKNDAILMVDARKIIPVLNYLVLSYSIFAFIISMIREIVKDIEDIKGDQENGYRTLPIVHGVEKSKVIITALSFIMIILVILAIYFAYTYNWLKLSTYLSVAVLLPLIYFVYLLRKSQNTEQFGDLSTLAKIIMIAGILSIQVFYINY